MGRGPSGRGPVRRFPHGGLILAAVWFVGAVLAAIWLGTWVVQIGAVVVLIALRILGFVATAVISLIGCGVMAVVDPKGFDGAWREARRRNAVEAEIRGRWS